MKFLVNAHLPRRLIHLLNAAGQDATHTLDLLFCRAPRKKKMPPVSNPQRHLKEEERDYTIRHRYLTIPLYDDKIPSAMRSKGQY